VVCTGQTVPVTAKLTQLLRSLEAGRNIHRGPGSSVSIATGHGLDGLGIESRWG
jgi:hypothetical protein